MEIKAIETEYNGYRFRSRLEARWAVFFDELGVEYEYEPEGFDLGNGLYYLPDFRVKCWGMKGLPLFKKPVDLWVEVKGVMTEYDAKKLKKFADSNSVLVVGNIPNPDSTDYLDSFRSHEEMNGTGIYPWNYELIMDDYYACYPAVTDDGKFYLDGDDYNYQTMDRNKIRQALRAARQARFEHGECGYQKRTFIPKDAVRVRSMGTRTKRRIKPTRKRTSPFQSNNYEKRTVQAATPIVTQRISYYGQLTWEKSDRIAQIIFNEKYKKKVWAAFVCYITDGMKNTEKPAPFQIAIAACVNTSKISEKSKQIFFVYALNGASEENLRGDAEDLAAVRLMWEEIDKLGWLRIPIPFILTTFKEKEINNGHINRDSGTQCQTTD